MLKILFLMKLR